MIAVYVGVGLREQWKGPVIINAFVGCPDS
jgi:hypothetical protein